MYDSKQKFIDDIVLGSTYFLGPTAVDRWANGDLVSDSVGPTQARISDYLDSMAGDLPGFFVGACAQDDLVCHQVLDLFLWGQRHGRFSPDTRLYEHIPQSLDQPYPLYFSMAMNGWAVEELPFQRCTRHRLVTSQELEPSLSYAELCEVLLVSARDRRHHSTINLLMEILPFVICGNRGGQLHSSAQEFFRELSFDNNGPFNGLDPVQTSFLAFALEDRSERSWHLVSKLLTDENELGLTSLGFPAWVVAKELFGERLDNLLRQELESWEYGIFQELLL